jgi:hypothetical protein
LEFSFHGLGELGYLPPISQQLLSKGCWDRSWLISWPYDLPHRQAEWAPVSRVGSRRNSEAGAGCWKLGWLCGLMWAEY